MTREKTKLYLSRYILNMEKAMKLKREKELYLMSSPSINKEIAECIRECGVIENTISSCDTMLKREILLRKFIYGQSLETIAEELNYSVRQIQRILNEAVDELSCKIK